MADETRERTGTHNEEQTASIRFSLQLIYFVTHRTHTIAVTSPHASRQETLEFSRPAALKKRLSPSQSLQSCG